MLDKKHHLLSAPKGSFNVVNSVNTPLRVNDDDDDEENQYLFKESLALQDSIAMLASFKIRVGKDRNIVSPNNNFKNNQNHNNKTEQLDESQEYDDYDINNNHDNNNNNNNSNQQYIKLNIDEDKEKLPQKKKTLIEKINWKLIAGSIIILCSAIAYSLMVALAKYDSDLGYGTMQIMGFRALVQIIIASYFSFTEINYNKNYKYMKQGTKLIEYKCQCQEFLNEVKNMSIKLHLYCIARAIAGVIAVSCYFGAITLLPIGDAIAIFSIYPVPTTLAAYFILKNKLSLLFFIAVIVVVIGAILTVQPAFIFDYIHGLNNNWVHNDSDYGDNNTTLGYILALVSCFSTTFVFIFIKLAKDAPTSLLIIEQGLACIVVGIVGCVIFKDWKDISTEIDWLSLIGLGLTGYVAQWGITKGTQLIPAGYSSLLRSTEIIWTYILQVIIFEQIPSYFTIIGAILMLVGVISVSWEKIRPKKIKKKEIK